MKMRALLWAIPLLLFLGLAALLMSRLGTDPTALPSARLGKPFPEFQLADLLTNQPLTLASIKGKPAVVNVWASWCPSCKEEHPALMKLAQQGLPIIGLNYKDVPDDAKAYLMQRGNPFQVIIADVDGNLGLDLGVYGAPETYLMDAKGDVVYRYVGVFDEKIWQSQLAPCYQQLLTGGEMTLCQ